MIHSRGFLLFTILGSLVGAPGLVANDVPALQAAAAAQNSGSGSSSKQEAQRQRRKAAKELDYAYRAWLDDVAVIMTDEERKAFLELGTNEEREQSIEIFWNRRKPDPESADNTYKEEYYRRLAYADERFASGILGRKTDRGRMYILWGPPDEIETHPTGGTYQRPYEQGGGSTTTFAWELWRYRHLDEVGENIEIEFVDPTGTGEYHITSDPCEKDALTHVPGAGPTLAESLGQASRASRLTSSNGTTCGMPIGGTPASMDEFAMRDRFVKVQRAPTHFKDLEEKVSARIVGEPLPFQYRSDFLRATSNTAIVPITIQLRNRDLQFAGKQGVQSAAVEIYGRISDPGGRVVQKFEDMVARDFPAALLQKSLELSSIYQKSVPLRAGLYRLDLVIKDVQSGKIGVLGTALRVPHFEQDKLDASSLILADQVELVAATQIGSGQFVLGAYKVRPRMSLEYASGEKLGIYLQLYNLQRDEETQQTKVSVAYRITRNGTEVWRAVETADHLHQSGEQLTIERFIPIATLVPGQYSVEVSAIDLVTSATIIRSTEFAVKAGPDKSNGAGKPLL